MPSKKLPDKRIPRHAAITQISRWKQQLLEAIVMNDEIAKLLYYNTSDALSRPTLTEDQKLELVDSDSEKRSIYPRQWDPDVRLKQQSFVGMSISGFVPQESFSPYRSIANNYVMGYIYFWILCDNEIMDCDEGQRQDLILQNIYDIFQDSTGYGMGSLQAGQLDDYWENNHKYGGYVLMMRIIDMKQVLAYGNQL